MTITARGLFKTFGGEAVVAGLDLEIAGGEIYGLMGPNGAGKTTTLRMLAGLMRPTAGQAHICGVDVTQRPLDARARLGFLTGSTGLYARLTVEELLMYFAQLNGMRLDAARGSIVELAGALSFDHLLCRQCGGLSTGERQRVSLARAVVHDPKVLILDEPTAGLDVLASRFVARFIRHCRDRGRAVLFSTHYMTEAELLCDRVGCLHRGKLRWEGRPADLRRQTGAASLEEAFLALIDGRSASAERGEG